MERAAGLILFRDNSSQRLYLLIKNHHGGHWGFPKGHVEAGEDELQAALREVAEEVRITRVQIISGFRTVVRYSFFRQKRRVKKEVVLFLARTEEVGEPSREEVDEMVWLPYREAIQRITFPEQQNALLQAETWLNAE
ncbi:MAG: bis(5'-nucleosyl)-tetraphosphatase [Candidatus Bipolaricaulaceae bacterium]